MSTVITNYIVAGDTAVVFQDTLTRNGTAEDLTDCTVELRFVDVDTLDVTDLDGVIVTAASGIVSCTPTTENVTALFTAGKRYDCRWRVTFSGGKVLSYPTNPPVRLEVVDAGTPEAAP